MKIYILTSYVHEASTKRRKKKLTLAFPCANETSVFSAVARKFEI